MRKILRAGPLLTLNSMVVRIASVVLSLAGLLALISGLLFWAGSVLNLVTMHMLLGFLAVAALWAIAIMQLSAKAGSWMIGASALIVGSLMIVVGVTQSSLMVGEHHWIIRVTHLTLGLCTIGIGHLGAARYRKRAAE